MTKICIVSDTHFGERGDSTVFLDYQKLFLDNVFFPTLEKKGVEIIIHPGDLVDRRKYININTAHRLWEDFLNPIQTKYKMYLIAGNHDIYHKNSSKINALNILLEGTNGNIQYFTDPVDFRVPGIDETFLFLPWINDDNRERSMELIQNSSAKVVFGHLELKDFPMLRGQLALHGMDAALFDKYEYVFSGHFHTRSNRKNIHYVGTPFQMNWGDFGEERGFHIFDLETRELEFIPNPYSLFNKFFYNDEGKTKDDLKQEIENDYFEQMYVKVVVEKKTDPYLFDWVVDRITEKNPLDLVIANAQEVFSRDYVQPIKEIDDTPTILKKCVESINVSDKASLENLLIELYSEAQSNTG